MEVHNLQEDFVAMALQQQLEQSPGVCSCDLCKRDMMVYALNRLPPRYVSHTRGRTFSRLELGDVQGKATVLAVVISAIKVVAQHPRH